MGISWRTEGGAVVPPAGARFPEAERDWLVRILQAAARRPGGSVAVTEAFLEAVYHARLEAVERTQDGDSDVLTIRMRRRR